MKPISLCLVFGGRSGEHEISVMSAASVYRASIESGYHVEAVGITREGRWVYIPEPQSFFSSFLTEVNETVGPRCYLVPEPSERCLYVRESAGQRSVPVDVVFPVLHGPFGEDGTIQGLLEMAGIPYVGAGVLASAACMDKAVTKKLLNACGVPCVPSMVIYRWKWREDPQSVLRTLEDFSLPAFVKPSGSGSSLGVSKVKRREEYKRALDEAFLYDSKAVVERSQEGFLEVECSVLGNKEPEASIPGEILPAREFYDYEAKYLDQNTRLLIPARLDEFLSSKVRSVAVAAYKACECHGMARVDFFVNPASGEVYVNELNTIPGFTAVSMYPKLWEATGLPYPALIRRLVELAVERMDDSKKEVRRR